MSLKHHNMEYYDAGFTSDVPRHYGDRYYAQDAVRDFWYGLDVSGLVMKDLQGNEGKIIIRGGTVTQNGAGKVDITEFVGYAPVSVDVMNSFAASPPTVTQEDVRYIRVYAAALPAFDLNALAIPPTWGSTNYLKIAYAEADGASRAKAKATGSYYYEKSPSYVITCDTSAPTAYEICLATITGTGGGAAITVSGTIRTPNSNILYATPNGRSIQSCVNELKLAGGGMVVVGVGNYDEQVDLSGCSNITLMGCQGAVIRRKDNSSYAIKSVNSGGSEKKGIRVIGLSFAGNSKTGNYQLLYFQYTDEFEIRGCNFDGNATADGGITYKNFLIDNCDRGVLTDNMILVSSDVDYASTNLTNVTRIQEDGFLAGSVIFCGTTAELAQHTKRGWTVIAGFTDGDLLKLNKTTANTHAAAATGHTHTLNDIGASNNSTAASACKGGDGMIYSSAGGGGAQWGVAWTTGAPSAEPTPPSYTLIPLIHR